MSRNTKDSNLPVYVEHNVDFRNRIYWISDDIDQYSITEAMRAIEIMTRTNKEPITIKVSSFGGDPYIAFGFYDYIKSLTDIHVTTECIGMAMSAGTIIFLAGDERKMTPNSTLMFHTVSSGVHGKTFEIKTEAIECDRILERMCIIYADESNLTKAQWKRKIKHEDVFIDHDQAKELEII